MNHSQNASHSKRSYTQALQVSLHILVTPVYSNLPYSVNHP